MDSRRKTTKLDTHSSMESVVVRHTIELRVVRGPSTGLITRIGDQPVVAGRDENADLFLDDAAASRRHFEVALQRGDYIVRDLESTNGTQLNKVPMLECRLNNGDVITVGKTNVLFVQELVVQGD